MKAKIHITLKNGVLDPQGKAIEHSLHGLGFGDVSDVRQGKYIELDVTESDKIAAQAKVEDMCRSLLANTVIENYSVEILD
ncbi:MAG: phosphoribosylformylglycinamidine synthase subunit PurS [Rhodospirillaceae bacterium]